MYLQGRYEVRVLDSFGLASRGDDCGAVYRVAPPKVNVCLPPGAWQTYDIEFRAPRVEDGKLIAPGSITVDHNGVRIHDGVELKETPAPAWPVSPPPVR